MRISLPTTTVPKVLRLPQLLVVLAGLILSFQAWSGSPTASTTTPAAGGTDSGADSAMAQTQGLLRNPDQRNQVLSADPKAQSVDKYVKSMSKDPADQQKMYDLSAEILPIVVKMAGDDPQKLQQLIMDAQKNPEKFFQSLPADEQAKIRQLSSDIEKKSPASVKP